MGNEIRALATGGTGGGMGSSIKAPLKLQPALLEGKEGSGQCLLV